MPVVGFLDGRSQDAIRERLRAFRQGLKDKGYVEGENVSGRGDANQDHLSRPSGAGAARETARALTMLSARYRGPPMTLANMRAQGVRSLAVTCELCHHDAVVNVDAFDDAVPVPAFVLCTVCGIIGAFARPNWQKRPHRRA
jgi:hypothetical protein